MSLDILVIIIRLGYSFDITSYIRIPVIRKGNIVGNIVIAGTHIYTAKYDAKHHYKEYCKVNQTTLLKCLLY